MKVPKLHNFIKWSKELLLHSPLFAPLYLQHIEQKIKEVDSWKHRQYILELNCCRVEDPEGKYNQSCNNPRGAKEKKQQVTRFLEYNW